MATKTTIEERAQATLKRLEEKDKGLRQMLKKAYAYAVFPSVGKASLVVGGAYGHGAVFERGEFIGHATISQLTVGVQVGGDTFSEILVFENKEALDRLKKGKMAFAANASAVLVKAGASGTKNFTNGVAAYAYSRGGMLLEAVIGGQKFTFKPADEQEQDERGEDEGEEQQQRGGKSGRGRGRAQPQASEEDDEDQDEGEEEGSDEGGEGEESGVLGRTLAGIKSASSRMTDLAKGHPLAATLVGTAAVAGVAFLVVRAVRKGREQSDDQAQDEGGERQDEGEDDEKGDTLNQLRRRRARA